MGKSCCAVGCTNRFSKGSGISFYRFPTEAERRERWIAAVNRKDWAPTNYTWICSQHFVSEFKSDDPLSPNYVPSVFSFVKSPVKRKAADDFSWWSNIPDRLWLTTASLVEVSFWLRFVNLIWDTSAYGTGWNDGGNQEHRREVQDMLSFSLVLISRVKRAAEMWQHASPRPAMQLQWAQITSPVSSTATQGLKGAPDNLWEWRTWARTRTVSSARSWTRTTWTSSTQPLVAKL